jgi:HK97 family phage major capsid protein
MPQEARPVARRYVNPAKQHPAVRESFADRVIGEKFSIAPGNVTAADRRAYAMLTGEPEKPPGAELDRHPWARSWSGYFNALKTSPGAKQHIANAMSERVPSEGGFLLSEALRSDVYSYIEGSIVRPRARVVPMTTYRLGYPTVDNPSQANGAGVLGGLTFSIVEEGQEIPASTAGFGRVTLEARKLAGLLEAVPNELIDDGGAAFDSFAGPAIGLGMAWSEDQLFLNGTGAGEPEGVLSAGCAITVNRAVSGTVSLVDVAKMWSRLAAPSAQQNTAVWLASTAVIEALATLDQTVDGTPIAASAFMLSSGSDGGWRLGPMPLIPTDHVAELGSTGDLVLADFGQYLIGDRQALQVTRAELGEGFADNTSDIKITARVDGRWLVREPVTPANGGATTSPLVVLSANT